PSPPPHLRYPSAAEGPPTSEEADSHSPTHRQPPNRTNNVRDDALGFPLPPPPSGSDGATIEVVRRPRGAPWLQEQAEAAGHRHAGLAVGAVDEPYVLELPPGVDVIESTARFCRKRGTGLCVLNGNGVVANVTLKQPSTTPGATVTFHGQFDILSISATVLPPSSGGVRQGDAPFAISLAGRRGRWWGLVVGPLVSETELFLITATLNSPSFERLQAADHDDVAADRDGGHESPQPISGGESGGAPLYSYQPADVIWAPAARQPQPPLAPPY
ncbi:putative DNA-binding protein escarola, partial [Phtheirospermum japonicum]